MTGPGSSEPGAAHSGQDTDFELDRDTSGVLTGNWDVGGGMNGGYLAAFCVKAVLARSSLPHPLSMTMHYLSRPVPGPAAVSVEPLREGRGHATYRFDLVQEDDAGATALRATGLLLTGRLREPGPNDFAPPPPEGPLPESCSEVLRVSTHETAPTMWARLDQRVVSAGDVFFLRTEPGEACTGGWTKLADGRETDVLCVAMFLDSWPPAVFSRTMRPDPAGAPTLEYTVHWRNRVPAGATWVRATFRTRVLAGGYVDESGELWSEDGVLLGESRQLARYNG